MAGPPRSMVLSATKPALVWKSPSPRVGGNGEFLQRQFWFAAGIASGRRRRGRGGRAHKAPADRGSVPRILPNHDLGGAARPVVSGQEYAVFQFDLVVECLEGPNVAVRQHQHHATRVA